MKVEWKLWVEDIQPGTPEYEKVRQQWLGNLPAGTSRTPEHELRVVDGVVGDRERDVNKPRIRLEIVNILGVKNGKKTKADNPPGRHKV